MAKSRKTDNASRKSDLDNPYPMFERSREVGEAVKKMNVATRKSDLDYPTHHVWGSGFHEI